MYDAGDCNISKLIQDPSQGKDSAKQNYYSDIHLFPQRNTSHMKTKTHPNKPLQNLYQINEQVSARGRYF